MYLWPTLYRDGDALFVRLPQTNQVVARFWPGQCKWQRVRKLWWGIYVRVGGILFDWPTCFERVE